MVQAARGPDEHPSALSGWGKFFAILVAIALIALPLGGYFGYRQPWPEVSSAEEPIPTPTPSPTPPPLPPFEGDDVYAVIERASGCLPARSDQSDPASNHPAARLGPRVNEIMARVAELRGLTFTSRPDVRFLDRDRLARALSGGFPRRLVLVEEAILKALRAVPADLDLIRLYDLQRRSIGGFYRPEADEILARKGLGPRDEEVLLAHELEHAVSMQNFADEFVDDPPRDEEEAVARASIVEGAASLLEAQYDLTFGIGRVPLQTPPFDSPRARRIPYVLTRSGSFAYFEGFLFACDLYVRGGWEAINRAYLDPPQTTAEVLFPDRYGDDAAPYDPLDPPPPGLRWREIHRQSFGAHSLLWLLQAPRGRIPSRDAAVDAEPVRRWNGGEIHVWSRGDAIAIAVGLVDADAGRGPTLCERLWDWMDDAFPRGAERATPSDDVRALRAGDGFVVLRCTGEGPRLAIAPGRRIAETIAGLSSDLS